MIDIQYLLKPEVIFAKLHVNNLWQFEIFFKSMKPKVELAPAYLIHSRNYQEYSLLLDFFTRDYGMIRCVAKGAKRSKKTLIQPFSYLHISFNGKGSLKTLVHFEISDTPHFFSGESLILMMYVNELLLKLLSAQEPLMRLFDAYRYFVNHFNHLERMKKYWLLRLFEKKLLAELGYGVSYTMDTSKNSIMPNLFYKYQHQLGFICTKTGNISGMLLDSLAEAKLNKLPSNADFYVCRNLFRTQLAMLLGNKQLNSRALFTLCRS